MFKELLKIVKAPGLPPGTVIYTGDEPAEPVKITVWDYKPDNILVEENVSLDQLVPFKNSSTVSWINIDGVHDPEFLTKFGEIFNIHPLVLEDLANLDQRAKLEDYDRYLFAILKMPHYDGDLGFSPENVGLILGPGLVISFQEKSGDVFDPVRERIRVGKGLIRKAGSDYLAYALIDTLVDHYFVVMDQLGERIEWIEQQLIETSGAPQNLMEQINEYKKLLILLRRAIWPFRELVVDLQKEETALIEDRTRIYLRDVQDHVAQLIEFVEITRERLKDLTDLFMTKLNNRMNEIMKTLTIVGGVFIPLTFVAGVYGMNFQHMPELAWPFGYYGALGLMGAMAIGLIFFFRRKGWFN
jgi:magnesium transporter